MIPPIPVSLIPCAKYTDATVERAVGTAFSLIGYVPRQGERILVKPNLLRAESLACTHPAVVRAACVWLLDHGVTVTLGDSPGFGTAHGIAKTIGLQDALDSIPGKPLRVQAFTTPATLTVPGIGDIGIARHALEVDSILSLPRVKAHSQMRMTLAVKNLFGCVCGLRKAVAHSRYGDKEDATGPLFPRYLAALLSLLPPQTALVDGVIAMHKKGPSGGDPYPLHLIAASSACAAVDTAMYSLLGFTPEHIPLWHTLQRLDTPGSFESHIEYHGSPPPHFSSTGFITPQALMPQSFHPGRLLLSMIRRTWARLRG